MKRASVVKPNLKIFAFSRASDALENASRRMTANGEHLIRVGRAEAPESSQRAAIGWRALVWFEAADLLRELRDNERELIRDEVELENRLAERKRHGGG